MFPPLDILLEYWMEQVAIGPLYIILHSLQDSFQGSLMNVFPAFGAVD